jgi:transcriptional regulator of acetoin/glycerol metabolism
MGAATNVVHGRQWGSETARVHHAARRRGCVATQGARAAASDAFEERYVLPLLERTQHNVSKAARLAGIDRSNYLYRMMKKHGIARKE